MPRVPVAQPDFAATYAWPLNHSSATRRRRLLVEYEAASRRRHRQVHRAASSDLPIVPELKGRVVNALGAPIDGQGPDQRQLVGVDRRRSRPAMIARPRS